MNLFKALLFHHGHIVDVELARSLAAAEPAQETAAQRARRIKRARRLAGKQARSARANAPLSGFR